MIKVIQQTPKGPELTNFDLHAKASIGKGLVTTDLKLSKRPEAPKFIRPVDMRPSTMKVLGKGNPDNIRLSRDQGVPSTHSMMPHLGNLRNQTGFLSGMDPQVDVNGKLMPRPDSAIPFLFTKIPQPK
jgi:hypothetical protein